MRFAYADPPYFGMGRVYGYPEWDIADRHFKLIQQLVDDFPDGWALSCNPIDLRFLLPRCPLLVHVGAWVKPFASFKPNVNPAYAWEPVIFHGGRRRGRDVETTRDWVSEPITLRKGLTGAKPVKFCRWVLDMLGYDAAQDELVDLFPGTGIMGRVAAQGTLA